MATQVQSDPRAEAFAIRESGLLLPDWYLARRPQAGGQDPVLEFCASGWRDGANPNPYFSTDHYLTHNQDVAAAGFNPLWHYLRFGEAEGRDPSAIFDVAWYRKTYEIPPGQSCLKHFLDRRLNGQVSPVPMFDAAWYLEHNRDVAAGGADPFEHFLTFGAKEFRNPSEDFDVRFYMSRYGEVLNGANPLLHYLKHRDKGGFFPSRPMHEAMIPGAVKEATRPSTHFEEFVPLSASAQPRAKLLAYYLPQFHRVAENEAWWGKGFTDWTNLARSLPRYAGHLQPRVPRDLGFYSLDDPATLRRQIEMARGAGLAGFVFYFYWFNGRRLLDKPLEQLLADDTLDFPFCAMWANENWTRRWDGLEREVLIAQEYRPRDDVPLVAAFARLFRDRRHIRVGGRPLLMIYRADLIPEPRRRIAAWRELFRTRHGEDPLIVMAQSLGDYDPRPYGLDGAVEFPPHKLGGEATRINDTLDLYDTEFEASVYRYDEIAEISLRQPVPDFPLIKGIAPGWDNDPRREGKGLVLHEATPAAYQVWLEKLCSYATAHPFHGEALICVNAWNEWAEGAFLEPDLHFGAAFLNATGRALCPATSPKAEHGILLVGHDAQPHGAQMLLLHIARHLRRRHGFDVHLLLLGVGPLLGQYYETATVSVAYVTSIIAAQIDRYREMGLRTAIVNTSAAARAVPLLEERGIAATLLVHEMPRLLTEHNLEIQARQGAIEATNLVFAGGQVRDRFAQAVDLPARDAVILPQGNYLSVAFDAEGRRAVRRRLGIGDDAFLILGVGFGDLRKGFDLFLQMSRALSGQEKQLHFLWVGDIHFTVRTYLQPEIERARATGRFHHIGHSEGMRPYFSAADVYALTSREDPYPTVVLEALACGVPCVAFDETGGIPDLLRAQQAGLIAPLGDVPRFEGMLLSLCDRAALDANRKRLAAQAEAAFSFSAYMDRLVALVLPDRLRISACVLNFNYARYLEGRLSSVFGQTYPVEEILLFDDASTDDSVAVAAKAAMAAGRDMRIVVNRANAGNIFAQWRRAAETAKGEYIWIAEADDEAQPDFLKSLVAALVRMPAPLLAMTDSEAINGAGVPITSSYRQYYFEAGAAALAAGGVWDAKAFAMRFLSVRNLILNVSAVLWRRDALLEALDALKDELKGLTVAGDWRVYLEMMARRPGNVAVLPQSLNLHRRHEGGATQRLDAAVHVGEIRACQEAAARLLGLDTDTRDRQAGYLDLVAEQLAPQPEPPPSTPKAMRQKPAKPRRRSLPLTGSSD